MATKQEIQASVKRLMQAFTAFKPDPEDMKGFMELVHEKLSKYTAFVILKAVDEIIETDNYFPRIAEMIARCEGVVLRERNRLHSVLVSYESDWYWDKLHSRGEWERLAGEFERIGYTAMAANVRERMNGYLVKMEKITSEQREQLMERVKGVREKMEAK